MNNRQVLLGRLTNILAIRREALILLEFLRIPILKWLIEIQLRIDTIDKPNLSEADYKEAVKLSFHEGLIAWGKADPDRRFTREERAWWLWYGNTLGVLPSDWGNNRIFDVINKDYATFESNFERMKKKEKLIPPTLSPLEFAALLLDPPSMNIAQIPPKHNFWYALGVEDAGEWHGKDGLTRLTTWNKRIEYIMHVFIRLLARKDFKKGWSEKIEYVPEYTEEHIKIGPVTEDKTESLGDDDRLLQFCELHGIEIDILTDGDRSRMLDELHAYDMGYDLASKTGVSMKDYYGDRADSEKTQRQRLHKKIREARDKVK